MTRPALWKFVTGNMAVVSASLIATLFLLYHWFIGNTSWIAPAVALLVAAWLSRAHAEVSQYRHWRRQWQSFDAPKEHKPPAAPSPRRRYGFLAIVVVASWVILALGAKTPSQQTALAYFTVAVGVYALLAWRGGRKQTAAPSIAANNDQQDVVQVCVSVPPSEPSMLNDAFARLPPYCRDVMQ